MHTFRSRVDSSLKGFTLIEVLIVLAIIAILALMAIPALYGNTARTQILDSMPLADIAKRGVASYYSQTGALPASNEAAGLPAAEKIIGNFVTGVSINDGAVNMTFGNNSHAKLKGKRLTIRPAIVKDTRIVPIAWICGTKAIPNGMDAGGVNVTDIPAEALPLECR